MCKQRHNICNICIYSLYIFLVPEEMLYLLRFYIYCSAFVSFIYIYMYMNIPVLL